MVKILFATSIIIVLIAPRGFAETFSDNGKWGEIKAAAYSATLYKNGKYIVDVKGLIRFKASFIQKWKFFQKFPETKLLNATILTNKKNASISVSFDYFWNDGHVKERLDFFSDSIAVSYSYMPSQEKNTSMFACLFRAIAPTNKTDLELTGMQRHYESSGALDQIGKWRTIKAGMKMVSIRGSGDCVLDLIAKNSAWLNIWSWPHLGVINNGNYPKWDKTTYKNGEEYKVEYIISIVKKGKRLTKCSPVTFTDANK